MTQESVTTTWIDLVSHYLRCDFHSIGGFFFLVVILCFSFGVYMRVFLHVYVGMCMHMIIYGVYKGSRLVYGVFLNCSLPSFLIQTLSLFG